MRAKPLLPQITAARLVSMSELSEVLMPATRYVARTSARML